MISVTAVVILGSLLAGQILCLDSSGCAVPALEGQATNSTVYRERSTALQIFTDAGISCSGWLVSWNFLSRLPMMNGVHFSLWRETPAGSKKYQIIADTPVNNYQANTQTWNSFSQFNPIPVQQGDAIGVFQDNWMVDQNSIPVPHADRFTTYPYEYSKLTFYRALISFQNTSSIYNGNGLVNMNGAAKDLRLPALQAVVVTQLATTPAPTPAPSPAPTEGPGPTVQPPPAPTSGGGTQRCSSPISTDTSSCPSAGARAVFDSNSGKCLQATLCPPTNANDNNFISMSDCAYWCGGQIVTSAPFTPARRCSAKPQRDVDFNNCAGPKSTRYYYNSATKQCVGFLGCVNNNQQSNNFARKDDCSNQCTGSTQSTATLPPATAATPAPNGNPCNARPIRGVDFGACGAVNSLPRYYYNNVTLKCIAFQGCINSNGGNNFDSASNCQRSCRGGVSTLPPATPYTTPSTASRCAMRPVRNVDFGSCPGAAANIKRYYFNVNTGSCVAFQGCRNPNPGNNFVSSQECTNACVNANGAASQPPPPPSSATTTARRCSANPVRGVDFGSCPGDNTQIRYYWSKPTSKCVGFQGCANANGNNWENNATCLANCASGVDTQAAAVQPLPGVTTTVASGPPDQCTRPPLRDIDFANCTGDKSTRWYYTVATKGCTAYTGCKNPGGNNFPSRAACASICGGAAQATRTARCRGNPANELYDCDETQRVANRTWFDVSTQTCTVFKYEVCVVPEANNFDSSEDCTLFCSALM